LFARRPRLGKVKTRLCPPLSPVAALELYRAFLTDAVALLLECSRDYAVELWWDGSPTNDDLAGLGLATLPSRVQESGDLGRRLSHAVEASDGPVVIIGADSPTLRRTVIDDAFGALDEACPLVLMPSSDGGYVLIGSWRANPGVFRDIPWGGPAVFRSTLERARELGLAVDVLPAGFDVDDEPGLRRLQG
jgi:rSAM/selenodomain-associated transferase 1